jgi:hypothetical protein
MQDTVRWNRYQVMRAMGWAFSEYNSAPASLIEEISMFIKTENKAEQWRMEQNHA